MEDLEDNTELQTKGGEDQIVDERESTTDDAQSKKEIRKKKLMALVDKKVNTEDFICEVEKYPCLWNSEVEEYSNTTTKLNSWSAIVRIFFPDFDEMTVADRNEICKYYM